MGGFVAYIVLKRHNGFAKAWIVIAQHPMAILAESDLNGYDLKVFFILASRFDFENLLAINQFENLLAINQTE
ncbi:hypothetical protein [Bartonella sp. AP57NXGY]|uniref:hypothetical protein n=1 Tax=Bartonella sp. AP57NXGY TaxID=3243497 RepID=UPI0035D0FC38